MTVSRRRTRWPNRDWVGPNAKLNKLGIMTPDHREEGFQLKKGKKAMSLICGTVQIPTIVSLAVFWVRIIIIHLDMFKIIIY
jgi:hypothetical protein